MSSFFSALVMRLPGKRCAREARILGGWHDPCDESFNWQPRQHVKIVPERNPK